MCSVDFVDSVECSKYRYIYTHIWTIKNFSNITRNVEKVSPPFSAPDCDDQWQLMIRITYDEQLKHDVLGIYLFLLSCDKSNVNQVNSYFTLSVTDKQEKIVYSWSCYPYRQVSFIANGPGRGERNVATTLGVRNIIDDVDDSLKIQCGIISYQLSYVPKSYIHKNFYQANKHY
ncbi:hypothetical protein B4U80_13669 [Leptotrombidium deliense]|uniref:MATH domain-containing protein n=1 Tax=Leptotrombidium deliense TaxID=299467 RepID=A0A443SN04_9ACAR|nr:hypothetical protein B4U80_13669 [Leptotrombidium deliense]